MSNIEKTEKDEQIKVRELGSKPVQKLFPKYCIPAIISLLIPCTQVVLDGAFLGTAVGPASLATIGILFPYFTLITAISNLIGNGGASICAIEIGKGNFDKARKVLAQSVFYCFTLTAMISVISLLFLPSIINVLGGRDEVAALAITYLRFYLITFPFMTTGFTIYYFIRADEEPILGSVVMIASPIAAILVEYLLIFKFEIGILASAIACAITLAPSCLLFLHFFFGKSQLRLRKSDFKIEMKQIIQINKVGFASCAIQLATCIVTIIVNNVLISLGAGMYEISAYGIINAYLYYVIALLAYSFGIGIQPIVSYNFGSGQIDRVKQALKYGCIYGTLVMFLIVGSCYLFIDGLTNLFTAGDPEFFAVAKLVIMKYLWGITLGTVTLVGTYFYQAIESSGKSTFLALSRSFIFLLPLLFLTSKLFGLNGIWYAFPAAEVTSFIATLIILKKETILKK